MSKEKKITIVRYVLIAIFLLPLTLGGTGGDIAGMALICVIPAYGVLLRKKWYFAYVCWVSALFVVPLPFFWPFLVGPDTTTESLAIEIATILLYITVILSLSFFLKKNNGLVDNPK